MTVIFCKTRHQDEGYGSYADFWRLVELADYLIIYVDEIDHHSNHTFIITPLNGEWNSGWQHTGVRIIHWDLEWRNVDNYPVIPGVSETWASDRWYAKQIGAKYIPLGSDVGLATDYGTPEHFPMMYDVALMAYLGPHRRSMMFQQLRERQITIAPNGWKQARHNSLKSSRTMLHIHQHDGIATLAPLRVALAAAYRLPLITETCHDYGILGSSHRLVSDYDNIPAFVQKWTHQNERRILADYGNALHGLLCRDYTFRKCVEAAL